uniref:Uncharacterized protein n=1 Tax=Siphoviridae sp. ct7EW56 TaxID=2827562 RepID=A0A8S5LRU0_9CAUD|nr:MAG TPA: hypothetical protein [Siphoviridae sp. ct7EW56]
MYIWLLYIYQEYIYIKKATIKAAFLSFKHTKNNTKGNYNPLIKTCIL